MKQFEKVAIEISDAADVPLGRDIYYQCLQCGDFVASQPPGSTGCRCGNIFIDTDYHRLDVEAWDQFSVVQEKLALALDEQLGVLLELESGQLIRDPSETQIREKLRSEEFAILQLNATDPFTYIQCAKVPDEPTKYFLERQEGSTSDHFSVSAPIDLERVTCAFLKYLRGDASWRTDFEWERTSM